MRCSKASGSSGHRTAAWSGRRDRGDHAVRVVEDRVGDCAWTMVGGMPAQHEQVGPGRQAGQGPARVTGDDVMADRDGSGLPPGQRRPAGEAGQD